MLRRPARLLLFIGVALLLAFLLGRAAAALYTEALWFDEVGYGSALWTRIRAIVTVRLVTGVLGGVIVLVNLWAVARHLGPVHLRRRYGNLEISEQVPRVYVRAGMLGAALLAGWWLSGIAFPGNAALAVLAWANRPTWGVADPLFQRDLSFYVFSLPVYAQLLDYILLAIVWSLLLSVIGYVLVGAVRVRDNKLEIDEHPRLHFAVLIAGLVLLFGIRYWLGRYGILLEGRGFSGGVGYTDVNARLPAQRVMAVLSVAAAGALLYGAFKRVWWPPVAAVVVFVVAALGLGFAYPSFVQQLRVEPNELSREREFIGWNIEYTRRAFGLADMEWQSFAAVPQPGRDWSSEAAWLDRLPLWDPEPLQDVFNQLQTFEGYYEFPSVDVDRYGPPGAEQPVAIGVREFKYSGLRDASQTWRTQHLNAGQVRGYGAVVTVSSEKVPSTGDPVYWLREMTPVQRTAGAPRDLELHTPAVYFGETMSDWLITGPASDTIAAGAGAIEPPGVGVGSFLRRLAFAIRFGERNLLFTGELEADSRLVFRRRVIERVSHIAPFLVWDHEPYPVIHEGRVQWLVDGYSAAATFPIAEAQQAQDGSTVRYLQNTVKATVDGFTGRVVLYAIAPDEPILSAYASVFPELFQPLSSMDAELRRHLRYPLSYVRLQAHILEQYHVDSPEVFYAGQDGWQVPQEAAAQGSAANYQPQYLFMHVPGEERAEFLLTLPFIARERQNMTAILLVRNDPARYGEQVLLELPRDGRTLGPTQVRAIIEQDAQISRELTFWRGAEREVGFGRVRVLPLDSAVLYVQPLFLSAATGSGSGGSIPQLQRVIVSDGVEVRMAESLRAALAALSGDAVPVMPPTLTTPAEPTVSQTGPARALGLFEEAERRLRAGDFRGFADAWEELARLLRQLAGERTPE
jgi:uncharacterized protein